MKRTGPLVILLACLSLISGYLFSHMSWIGRVGINLMYKDYSFLKVWWQGALVVFIVFMALLVLQYVVHRYMPKSKANIVHLIALFAAVFGLYYTYHDFQHYYAHRWLKEKFHLGAYIFWFGWMAISLFYLFSKKGDLIISDKTGEATP
ncbi:cytochrome d ubiquinol oxidase subunit II [Chitinophagaceae bacterium MMS25-I14]